MLGPFTLIEPIGQGGMGEVWRAVHRAQGVPVAVKVLTRDVAQDPVFLSAFRNEVRAVAGLDHRAIVAVFDHGRLTAEAAAMAPDTLREGAPYVVMELVSGGTLNRFRGAMAWPALRDCLLELLAALAHAHARGVIHRDLKPGNVLMPGRSPRELRLADFGLAHAMSRQQTIADDQLIMGTPGYMPPEQVEGRWRRFGPWTDLYSLGCTAWALVCGLPPFGRTTGREALAAQLVRPPPDLAPEVPMPSGFEPWLRQLLAKAPEHRFQTAADAAWALLGIDDDRPDVRSPRRARRPEWLDPSPGAGWPDAAARWPPAWGSSGCARCRWSTVSTSARRCGGS